MPGVQVQSFGQKVEMVAGRPLINKTTERVRFVDLQHWPNTNSANSPTIVHFGTNRERISVFSQCTSCIAILKEGRGAGTVIEGILQHYIHVSTRSTAKSPTMTPKQRGNPYSI